MFIKKHPSLLFCVLDDSDGLKYRPLHYSILRSSPYALYVLDL